MPPQEEVQETPPAKASPSPISISDAMSPSSKPAARIVLCKESPFGKKQIDLDQVTYDPAIHPPVPAWPSEADCMAQAIEGVRLASEAHMSNGGLWFPESLIWEENALANDMYWPTSDGCSPLRAEAAEFVPPPSVDGVSPRSAVLTMCGAWGAIAGKRSAESGALKSDPAKQLERGSMLKYRAAVLQTSPSEIPPVEGLRAVDYNHLTRNQTLNQKQLKGRRSR